MMYLCIVLFFNIYWYFQYKEEYLLVYKEVNKINILIWLYNLSGILSFVFFLYNFNK